MQLLNRLGRSWNLDDELDDVMIYMFNQCFILCNQFKPHLQWFHQPPGSTGQLHPVRAAFACDSTEDWHHDSAQRQNQRGLSDKIEVALRGSGITIEDPIILHKRIVDLVAVE